MDQEILDVPEWNNNYVMLRLLGEIKQLFKDEFSVIQHYNTPQHIGQYQTQKKEYEGKDESIRLKLKQYSSLFWHVYSNDSKQYNQLIQVIMQENHWEKRPIQIKLQYRDTEDRSDLEVDEIKESGKKNSESVVQLVRLRKCKWWCIRFIKLIESQKIVTTYDMEVFLCDHQSKQKLEHKLDIMIKLNQWFKMLYFHPNNRKSSMQFRCQKEIIQYIEETMEAVFSNPTCNKCKNTIYLGADGSVTVPYIKLNEPYIGEENRIETKHQLYHPQCIFNS